MNNSDFFYEKVISKILKEMKMFKGVILTFSACFALLFTIGCRTCVLKTDSGTAYAAEEFQKYVDSGEISGVISVFHDNGTEEISCVGYADPETRRPITIDDSFMQCSQTKGFCGVTVAMLVEEGKLSLDDPVSKYLPEFKNLWVQSKEKDGSRKLVKAKNVLTVRMCLNHTGGFSFELPNFQAMGGWSRRMPLRSVAAIAAAVPLNFEPGTKPSYSNVGIDVGAAVVEVITKKRWEDFLRERVLDPLGMKSTTFFPCDRMLERKIELCQIKMGTAAKKIMHHPSMQRPYGDDRVFSSAGAGLWTTVRDQIKFYKMLMNLGIGDNGVRILKEETVKELLAKSTRPENMPGYSLGLSAPVKDSEDSWFGHGGAWCTQCEVNWHKKQLKLVAVQAVGPDCGKIRVFHRQAADKFFRNSLKKSGTDDYTGRLK